MSTLVFSIKIRRKLVPERLFCVSRPVKLHLCLYHKPQTEAVLSLGTVRSKRHHLTDHRIKPILHDQSSKLRSWYEKGFSLDLTPEQVLA